MISRENTENVRVKIPALIQFKKIGYDIISSQRNKHNETKIYIDIFKESIERINNKSFSIEEINSLLIEITNLANRNDNGKELYRRLVMPTTEECRIFDFDNIDNNNFSASPEVVFTPQSNYISDFRVDIVPYINGYPISMFEVKPPDNNGGLQEERTRFAQRMSIEDYKKYFNLIPLLIISNNMEYEDAENNDGVIENCGTFYATPNGKNTLFSPYRIKKSEDGLISLSTEDKLNILRLCMPNATNLEHIVQTPEFEFNTENTRPTNKFITAFFNKENIMYLLKYGFLFEQNELGFNRVCMRYPQITASKNSIYHINNGEKKGIIWHTQGSGKTNCAAFMIRPLKDNFATQNKVMRPYFVVDRLDLLIQASNEFQKLGFSVTECKNKEELKREINRPIGFQQGNTIGEIVVVNIQKFEPNIFIPDNDYNIDSQPVVFIDEAHRSYQEGKKYFTSLMSADRNSIFIGLTATPVLNEKNKTTNKFGNYWDTYSNAESIADGYTLKLKREVVKNFANAELQELISVHKGEINTKTILESNAYIESVCGFIVPDFETFREIHNDNSTGAMITCYTNLQARLIGSYLQEKYPHLKVGVVLSPDKNDRYDSYNQAELNRQHQIAFKQGDLDIVVVHYMLTTGYNAPRLKRLYVLRSPKDHSLLQLIARPNRPYTSPNGVKYEYGYIIDFMNFEESINKTIDDYKRELENYTNNQESYESVIVDVEFIKNRYRECLERLIAQSTIGNFEIFRNELDRRDNEEKTEHRARLYLLRKLLREIDSCYNELLVCNDEYFSAINIERFRILLNLVDKKIKFLNIAERPTQEINLLNDNSLVNIVYEFVKTHTTTIDFVNATAEDDVITNTIREIFAELEFEIKHNQNKDDEEFLQIDQALSEIFENMSIVCNLSLIPNFESQLQEILTKIKKINAENERLAQNFGGNFAYVKTIQFFTKEYIKHLEKIRETLTREEKENIKRDIEEFLKIVYHTNAVQRLNNSKNDLRVLKKDGFIDDIKEEITNKLTQSRDEKPSIYRTLLLRENYDVILEDLYNNLIK